MKPVITKCGVWDVCVFSYKASNSEYPTRANFAHDRIKPEVYLISFLNGAELKIADLQEVIRLGFIKLKKRLWNREVWELILGFFRNKSVNMTVNSGRN